MLMWSLAIGVIQPSDVVKTANYSSLISKDAREAKYGGKGVQVWVSKRELRSRGWREKIKIE